MTGVIATRVSWSVVLLLAIVANIASASNHYTAKQIEVLASRVGQLFWSQPVNGKGPSLRATAAANAKQFRLDTVTSFEIVALVGAAAKIPYYKIRLEDGKEAYLSPEDFLDGLNNTIVKEDPSALEKKRAAELADADKKRIDWIQEQPWAPQIKEAAIKKQPVPGLTAPEIRRVIGPPQRIAKVRTPMKIAEEHWFYADGSVLTFHNGMLSKVERR